jgi:hypothetical protein
MPRLPLAFDGQVGEFGIIEFTKSMLSLISDTVGSNQWFLVTAQRAMRARKEE